MDYNKEIHNSCFSFLSDFAAKQLFTHLVLQEFEVGDDLSSVFCFVVAGELDVRCKDTGSKIYRSHLLARIAAGSFVGEGILLGDNSSFFEVVGVREGSVVTMTRDAFEQYLQVDNANGILLLKNILSIVHKRLGYVSARLVHVL